MPAFYSSVPRKIRDLRSGDAPAENTAEVIVEPASETTNDEPQLTDARVAPEASPAKTKGTRKKSKKASK